MLGENQIYNLIIVYNLTDTEVFLYQYKIANRLLHNLSIRHKLIFSLTYNLLWGEVTADAAASSTWYNTFVKGNNNFDQQESGFLKDNWYNSILKFCLKCSKSSSYEVM